MKGRLLSNLIVINVMVILLLIATIFFFEFKQKKDPYFSITSSGTVQPLVGLENPYNTTDAVLKWASIAAVSAYTYGFSDYEGKLEYSSRYFTDEGWTDFMQALNKANVISEITAKKIDMTSVAVGPAIVLEEGTLFDTHVWRIKVPLLVTYQSLSEKKQNYLVISMLVKKVSTLEMPQGIGIAQMQVIETGNL